MKATWVPDRLTQLTFTEAKDAMFSALMAHGNDVPTAATLSLALAKTALETGRWQKIHCYNWGNIKASESYEGLYTTFTCDEVINGKRVPFSPTTGGFTDPPGHPQTRFRAHRSAADGAVAYVNFVANGRYAGAWQYLMRGMAEEYVHELKRAGYFTAAEEPYKRAVVSLQKEFMPKCSDVKLPPARISDEDRENVERLIAIGLDAARFEDVT